MEEFGRYQVLERIAQGGMAEILLAHSDALGGLSRTCVIKRIRESYSSDLQFVSLFIDEARITIGLEHENVVRMLDFGQVDGTYFMAMEYVDGTDLSALMRAARGGQVELPLEAAAFIVREMLAGLEYAHGRTDHKGVPLNLVHRDVSPHNVLLSRKGDVKLADFGIAAARNKITATTPGMVLGKCAYIAPEQAQAAKVTGQADVWACGVILHEMLTGTRLFRAENDAATLSRVMGEPVAPPSFERDIVPDALDGVALKALERGLDARYPDAAAMRRDLDAYLEQHPFGRDDLAGVIDALAFADETLSLRPEIHSGPSDLSASPDETTLLRSERKDNVAERLLRQLTEKPDLWTLVALGERYSALDDGLNALEAFRCAAAVFAHRGLLLQALCAYDGARAHLLPPAVFDDLMALSTVNGASTPELLVLLERWGVRELWERFDAAESFDEARTRDITPKAPPTPLFSDLAPRDFAQLADAVKVRKAQVGDVIVDEGDSGESLFGVGQGRLVVYCRPGPRGDLDELDPDDKTEDASGQRVYLAALADGDFFGEFSFLTQKPRSASVEAIGPCRLLEVRLEDVDEIFDREPGFTEPILRFYKSRVVELMMAKSALFAGLKAAERKRLLESATVQGHADGDLVVQQGKKGEALYFIKSGEAEVFTVDDDGHTIFINKLAQGEFFGEIAALTGEPRTVNVRAMGDLTVFRIAREALMQALGSSPELKALLEDVIASRTAHTEAQVGEHRRVFYGV